MASIKGDKDRHVIPNWRNYQTTANLGELNGSINASLDYNFKPDISDILDDWEENKTIGVAGDILGVALTCNQKDNIKVQEIARFIEENKGISSKALLEAANQVLFQPVIVRKPIDGYLLAESIQKYDIYQKISTQKKILLKNPRNAIAWVELSRLYSIQGLDKKAERAMKNALFLAPENRFVLRSMARFFSHLGNLDFADEYLRNAKITKYDPWVMATAISVADLVGKSSKFTKSGLIKVNSDSFHPFSISELSSAIATLELKHNNIKSSRKLFKKSLINPNDNSLAQAEWASQKEIKLDSVNPSSFNIAKPFEALARDSKEKGDWEKSISYAKDWFLDMPYSKGAILFGYDIALLKMKNFNTASEIGKLGLISHPNDPFLINNIVYALILGGNIDEAEILLTKIKPNKLKDDNLTYICLTATKGLLNYRKGNIESGRNLYLRAMSLAKESGDENLMNLAFANFAREEILNSDYYDVELLSKLKSLKKKTNDEQVIELIDEILAMNEQDR